MGSKYYKYGIRYTTEKGDRKIYMNIGFDTKELAENELRKIKEQRKKLKGIGTYLNHTDRACITGKNFRIRKISVILCNLLTQKK